MSASFTLMAALVLIAVRFPHYLRGQQIERELNLARRVQADLLPSAETISPYVDFSAECISAWQVGGDFCDVFHVAEDRTALVLGDVSGKGISAALLMALIHGAIHSVSWTRSTQDHVNASRQLNTLLCQKTAIERFTSLFWGYFDPQRSTIQYINAGHLPPLLLRKTNNELEIHRLETGGPVMGLLPGANFQQGEEFVAPGDLLVAFSDGVVEATSPSGEEFGDKRLIAVIQELWDSSASDIRNAIHARLKEFTGNAPVDDDQTLIVVRFKHTAANLSETRSSAVSVSSRGPALLRFIRKSLILIHRYLGIVLCLLFFTWFVSGIAMIYARGMPDLTPEARLTHLPVLDPAAIQLTPAQALARAATREFSGRCDAAERAEPPGLSLRTAGSPCSPTTANCWR